MKTVYTQTELNNIVSATQPRSGWDFSSMKTQRAAVPWDYIEVVKKYLKPTSTVLDVGTGGGERFAQLAPFFESGVGVDIDPEMVATARQKAKTVGNVRFEVMGSDLNGLNETFDIIINRHAPFDPKAIHEHLKQGGLFITQQVGEKNMQNIKQVLGQQTNEPTITKEMLESAGLEVVDFREYNVEYVVQDIESLVFWLNALDMLHADLKGSEALQNVDVLNKILAGHVDDRGFVTNEQRYLAIAKRA